MTKVNYQNFYKSEKLKTTYYEQESNAYISGQNRNPSKDCPWTGFLIGKGIVSLFHSKIFSETWDGVVKQAHGVIYQEYYLNPRRTWKSLEEYLQFYNYERIHLGKYLNGMILVEKWQKYLSTVSPLKVN